MRHAKSLAALFGVVLTVLAAALVDATAQQPVREPSAPAMVAATAGDVASAVVRLRILDESGRPMAGRWTFVGEKGPGAELFANTQASPGKLAVRKDVVYSLSGEAAITVPAGKYEVYASRGLEWSVARTSLALDAGREYAWDAPLVHEVDTRGWISGDFHLHTLTFSGHGDADLDERVISLIGEGVEFAVATDHNHNTDYGPTLEKLSAGPRLRAITGNEVTTPIGHFNAFPVEPDRPVIRYQLRDANEIFRLIRAEKNRFGIVPVVQLNHPRWYDLDYFRHTELDPVTGVSSSSAYSSAFDSIEIFNANPGWGYFDAETGEHEESAGVHCVLEDWFNLLNAGERHAAVGNSDSHTVHADFAGYPRNFVPSASDDPAQIDPAAVALAIKQMRVFTTLGPFVEFTLGGARSGSTIAAQDGVVELEVRIQAASWVDCDRVKIVINGDVVDVMEVPQTREPVRLEAKQSLGLVRDAWITVLVEGDDPLAPIVQDQARPVFPLAVLNPVWVDADGDGKWTSPREQARARVASATASDWERTWGESLPAERALFALAAAEVQPAFAEEVVSRALADSERKVVLAGARAAEQIGGARCLTALVLAGRTGTRDGYARLAFLRAMRACGVQDYAQRFQELLAELGERRTRYDGELSELLPGRPAMEWWIAGYFPLEAASSSASPARGPELDSDVTHTHAGKLGASVAWARAAAGPQGYLDLRAIDPRPEACEHALAYAQTWLYSPAEREVSFAFGTDDGCRLWIGGKLLVEDHSSHAASPLQAIGKAQLAAGWNRVLFEVANGTGHFGLYFRILDDEVTAAGEPR